jgi:hypothetical protein
VEGRPDDASNCKRLCTCIIEFLSSHATDPHLYFELKMGRELSAADSLGDLIVLTNRLLGWVEALDLPPVQMERFDAALRAKGLPSFSVIRSAETGEMPRVLAIGRIHS